MSCMAAFLCLALIFSLLTGEKPSLLTYILFPLHSLILLFPHHQPISDTRALRVFCCNHHGCLLSSYPSKALEQRWRSGGQQHVIQDPERATGTTSTHTASHKQLITFPWCMSAVFVCLGLPPTFCFPLISSIKVLLSE